MKLFRTLKQEHDENGMTVVEVMIAIVIIAIVLVFTGIGLSNSFQTSSTTENRTKAASYAADVASIAKQAPYRQLWVNVPPITSTNADMFGNQAKCRSTIPTGLGMNDPATSGQGTTPFPGIEYCQVRQASNENNAIGPKFYIQTAVYYVDSTSATRVQKRVIITIRWVDTASGDTNWNTYQASVTRSPAVGDCIPTALLGASPQAAGCG